MTHATPPGWHRDPGHTGDGPALERWWDGNRWTGHTRDPHGTPTAPGTGPAYGAGPAYGPGYDSGPGPGYGPGPGPGYGSGPGYGPGFEFGFDDPARKKRKRRQNIAAFGAAAVLIAASAGGVFLLTDDNGGSTSELGTRGPDRQGPSDDRPGSPESPGAPESPAPSVPGTESGYATDLAAGISIPVLTDWTGESAPVGASVTTGTYECPGDPESSCVRGGVFSAPAAAWEIEEKTAKAAALADIEANAEDSYGGATYGDITSHEELSSEPVTVAGKQGYQVRWKVVTEKGDDGYVQSLAFPSPHDPATLVLVRSGFDVNDKAPTLSDMDRITKGIKKSELWAGPGAGTGKDV